MLYCKNAENVAQEAKNKSSVRASTSMGYRICPSLNNASGQNLYRKRSRAVRKTTIPVPVAPAT